MLSLDLVDAVVMLKKDALAKKVFIAIVSGRVSSSVAWVIADNIREEWEDVEPVLELLWSSGILGRTDDGRSGCYYLRSLGFNLKQLIADGAI